jgi:hypothetical protein
MPELGATVRLATLAFIAIQVVVIVLYHLWFDGTRRARAAGAPRAADPGEPVRAAIAAAPPAAARPGKG